MSYYEALILISYIKQGLHSLFRFERLLNINQSQRWIPVKLWPKSFRGPALNSERILLHTAEADLASFEGILKGLAQVYNECREGN